MKEDEYNKILSGWGEDLPERTSESTAAFLARAKAPSRSEEQKEFIRICSTDGGAVTQSNTPVGVGV